MDRRSRTRLIGALAAAIALAGAAAGGQAVMSVEQRGIFALLGGAPKIVSTARSEAFSDISVTLVLRQFRSDGKTPIVNYDVDMQKLIHLIVVRDDFRTFMHLHPVFDRGAGTFRQPFSKDAGHRYYAYADTTPHGIGQQVFRFTIAPNGSTAATQPTPQPLSATPSPPSVSAGTYGVALARTTLHANVRQSLDVTVVQGGRPARDLTTYLGAAAHAVFIDTATLEYVHIHPTLRGAPATAMGAGMNMNGSAQAGPLMTMAMPALPAGTYKLWIQFAATNGAVYTAPFTLRVR